MSQQSRCVCTFCSWSGVAKQSPTLYLCTGWEINDPHGNKLMQEDRLLQSPSDKMNWKTLFWVNRRLFWLLWLSTAAAIRPNSHSSTCSRLIVPHFSPISLFFLKSSDACLFVLHCCMSISINPLPRYWRAVTQALERRTANSHVVDFMQP